MPTYDAGDARIRIIPDSSKFLVDLERDLARKRAEFAVEVTADTGRATTDIDQFVARNTGRDITVGVRVDQKRARTDILDQFNKIGDEIGNSFSAIGSGLKFPALFAGVGELPAATLAITNVAGALQQLAGAGLAVPGIIGGIASSFATAKLGVAGVSDAFDALQASSDGSAASLEKANDALGKLAPNAADAVRAASDVTTELREALQQPIQQNLFAGVSDDLRKLVAADLPILQKGLGGIATGLNENLRQVLTSLGSEQSQGLLDRILGNTADAQSRFTEAIDPIVTAIGTLTAAGTDVLPRLADGLGAVGQRFERFITSADQDGRLDKWINEGIDGFGHLGETVLSIGKILGSLTEAAGGDGGLLKLLDDGASKLATFLNSAEGQNTLQEWFAEGREQLGELVDLAGEVGPALKGMFEAGKNAADVLVPAITDIIGFLNDIPGGVEGVVTAFVAWKGITAAGDLAGALTNVSTILRTGLPNAATAGAASMTASLGPVAAAIAAIAAGIPILFSAINRGENFARQPGEDLDAYLKRAQEEGATVPGLAPTPTTQNPADLGGLLGAAPPAAPANPREVQGPVAVGAGGSPFGPGGALSGGATPPTSPQDLGGLLGGYATGGPTPGGKGNGPTGGFISELHGDEWVLPAHARKAVGDEALWALTQGRSFAPGGFIDPFGNPVTPGPLPGPAAGADAPTGYANGAIGSVANSFLGGLGGPLSGILGGITGAGQAASGAGAGGGGGGGFNLTPGLAGLAQAGSDPALLDAWGQQTGDWLGKFGAKTLTSFGSTLWSGLLGLVGLENSILSPSNTYTAAALKGAGFFLGNDGPLVPGTAAQGADGATIKPATDKQLREGQQTVDRADQRIAEITARLAELPADAKASQRLSIDNDLANAKQDADDARADMLALQSKGSAAGTAAQPGSLDALPPGVGDEKGLQVNTIKAKRAISAAFPQITSIGGYRQDSLKWHPNGLAIDVMIPGAGGLNDPTPAAGKALGDQIYGYVMANKAALGVDYVMWQVKDHFNHLHVNTTGGGYPQGYAGGGGVPGVGMGDTVPAMLTPGEHVLTTKDVDALGGQTGVYAMRDALHMAVGGGVPFPTGAVIAPRPPRPRPPEARKLQPRPRPAPPPVAPATVAPAAPAPGVPDVAPTPPPTAPPSAQEDATTPPTAPVGGPAPVASAPSSYDHNLPAVNTAISSAASTLGSIAQTAAAVGTFGAAGMAGGLGGGLGGGGGGPSIQGLFQLGGKAVSGLVNVGSSLLVGNVTPGTTDNAYGETLSPPQKQPQTAPIAGGSTYNIQAGYRPADIMDAIAIKEAQDGQARLARFGG